MFDKMFLLLFLAWVFNFSSTFALEVPVCKTVRHFGTFKDNNFSTLYSFSFDLSVIKDPKNASYPNTVTFTNFTESFLNSSYFNRISPWSFVLYNKMNKKTECETMTENCIVKFPNGQQRYFFEFSYLNQTDSSKFFALGSQVFVNDGIFFDGLSGDIWNPFQFVLNKSFDGTKLVQSGTSYCTKFDSINIPEKSSTYEMCNTFEFNSTITIPSESVPVQIYAKIEVTNTTYKMIPLHFLNYPVAGFKWNDYLLDPTIPISTKEYIFPVNFQYEFLFDFITNEYQMEGVFLGELIGRNGVFYKNQNIPYTPSDPCWIKNSNVPFTDATYSTYFCCTNFGDAPTTTTPPPSSDPVNGTLCSSDTTSAWLDVVFVVDISSAMSTSNLNTLSGEIASQMLSFNIGSKGNHTTRAGIVLYATNATIFYHLSDTTNFNDFENKLTSLSDQQNSGDSRVNVQNALLMASNMIPVKGEETKIRHRIPIIALFAAAYNSEDNQNIGPIVNRIKEDGITILVVNYDPGSNQTKNSLKKIASFGYYYTLNQDNLFPMLTSAYTQINCVCPPGWSQLAVNNTISGNFTKYADCYWSDGAEAYAQQANDFSCKRGKLITLSSQNIFDFITETFLPWNSPLKGKKKIIIGLHKSALDGTWKWWGYNGTEIPYTNFPPMSQPGPNDDFAYLWNYYGFKWNVTTGYDIAMQFICQRKACDAEFICDERQ